MIAIVGGDLILPDRIVTEGSLLLERSRIAAIETRRIDTSGAELVDATGCYVMPGFIDVHVHGIEGDDTLDGEGSVARIASRLVRHGVTAFCPTTVACAPQDLDAFLAQVGRARIDPDVRAARVLPAHLESNFINPDYRGAQPVSCLRTAAGPVEGDYSGRDILAAIERGRADVGIVTLAPEMPGGVDLVRDLVAAGHRVSLGHSGADFETAIAAIDAGARHATHLFNRMTPLTHRAPGVAGAVLARDDVAAELICDGIHVHPAVSRVAIAAKRPARIMAITDATAGAGLPVGSSARLGGRTIHVRRDAAFLDDGTLAGSTLTMNRAFKAIMDQFFGSPVDAAFMCATTPARELGLGGLGVLAEGAVADVVVLDRDCQVVRTFIGGQQVWANSGAGAARLSHM
jgi:N-acetylglucosamine-6-phosphate deacetylase